MNSNRLQKLGGISAILEALIYISTFIVYGGILAYPSVNANTFERFKFLIENYTVLFVLNLVSYVLFGIVLAILVLAIYELLKLCAPIFSRFASVFGYIWVTLVIASGMIANIGLSTVIDVGHTDPEAAMLIWKSVSIVSEGLGGGNEIVGGIWVLLISIGAYNHKLFSKALIILGVLVGILGVLTIYPLDLFTELFGLTQIIWFVWIGVSLIRKSSVLENVE